MDQSAIAQRVIDHLFKQGRPAANYISDGDKTCCMYRMPDGRSCAVGCLIDDNFYTPAFENLTVQRREVQNAVKESINQPMYETDVALLAYLQSAHDRWAARKATAPDALLVGALRDIANDFNLNVIIPEIK
jgi:hypothetical protein